MKFFKVLVLLLCKFKSIELERLKKNLHKKISKLCFRNVDKINSYSEKIFIY
jgi:hypothetical protein